jgi:hypothetical protein
MPAPSIENLRSDLVGGLVSSTLAIPLALGYGMFVFVTLGDEYFAQGALAGMISAFIAVSSASCSATAARPFTRRASPLRSF